MLEYLAESSVNNKVLKLIISMKQY